MKRILLFAATNIAVLVVISVVVKLLGLDAYLDARGGSLAGLLLFSAIFGFGGAFISLALSKSMAKLGMGVRVIAQPRTEDESWLVATVSAHAERLGLGMPEVGVFDSPTMNAFATGASRNRALVAVSTGLLLGMGRQEMEAVLGHEMSHVANGDMVTMTLLQGVLNTFVIFLARVVGTVVDNALRGERDQRAGSGPFYFVIVILLQVVFGVLASVIAMWFSRYREFRADAGGARLAGRDSMIGALLALQRAHGQPLPGQLSAFGIQGGSVGRFFGRLFMTHPPLDERIAALRAI
ncbi:MAG: protease HtpX [Gammaproteobacteria bacterium]